LLPHVTLTSLHSTWEIGGLIVFDVWSHPLVTLKVNATLPFRIAF